MRTAASSTAGACQSGPTWLGNDGVKPVASNSDTSAGYRALHWWACWNQATPTWLKVHWPVAMMFLYVWASAPGGRNTTPIWAGDDPRCTTELTTLKL